MYPNVQAYDRGVMFNPDGRLFQVEYAKEAVRKGATSIGLIAEDAVVFVAHKNIVEPLSVPTTIQKVFRIDAHIGATYSGMVAYFLMLVPMEEQKNEAASTPPFHPSFARVLNQKQQIKEKLLGIRHKIGIYSAKGGVGKTTVAVNLAYTLRDMGFKVGLLDADVDTPNVAMFIGMNGIHEVVYPLRPVERHGVKVLSTAMFIDESTKPIIWRGPMVAKMITEFFDNSVWGELDYLILDLPPGTSDAPLSVMQLLDMDGFILVTTPQHVAAVNAIRSGRMIKRMGISILGVVENMSQGDPKGAMEVAEELGCEVLGTITHDNKFGALSDSGVIPVTVDSSLKVQFTSIAERIADR